LCIHFKATSILQSDCNAFNHFAALLPCSLLQLSPVFDFYDYNDGNRHDGNAEPPTLAEASGLVTLRADLAVPAQLGDQIFSSAGSGHFSACIYRLIAYH
jgi:hypothetical protein